MINQKLYVFEWTVWMTSGFPGNLALFKCSVSSLITVFSQINIFFFLFCCGHHIRHRIFQGQSGPDLLKFMENEA